MSMTTQDFHVELLKQKTQSRLIIGRLKSELLATLSRLNSSDIVKISDALDDIDLFIVEKYKEIENRGKNVSV